MSINRRRRKRTWLRWSRIVMLSIFLSLSLPFLGRLDAAPGNQTTERGELVYVLTFEGAVTPVLEQYITQAIEDGVESGAEALILRLDTPGGSVNVTKSITQEMLASPVPI